MSKRKKSGVKSTLAMDGPSIISRVLKATKRDVDEARRKRDQENSALSARGKKAKPEVKAGLSFAIYFAKHVGTELTVLMAKDFPQAQSGEKPSRSSDGVKRVDLCHITEAGGLEVMVSFKSVHFGERAGGDSDFTHNMKRNDEELRVEATKHHLRQPYAVLCAILFLPFEACVDDETSSLAKWVEYLWPLKGRVETDDPPDKFELVFIGLYARDGSQFGFYEVGGHVGCPRRGEPRALLSPAEWLARVKTTHHRRNSLDFHFEGEGPPQ